MPAEPPNGAGNMKKFKEYLENLGNLTTQLPQVRHSFAARCQEQLHNIDSMLRDESTVIPEQALAEAMKILTNLHRQLSQSREVQ